MSSPTIRASNVWQTEAADDILQINTPRGPVISGIDSTGAGFGALAGGGTPGGSTGAMQFNGGSGFVAAAGINSSATAFLSSDGNMGMVSPGSFRFLSSASFVTLEAVQNVNLISDGADVSLEANQNVSLIADNAGIILTATNGFIDGTALGAITFTSSDAVALQAASNVGITSTTGNINLTASSTNQQINMLADGLLFQALDLPITFDSSNNPSNIIFTAGSAGIHFSFGHFNITGLQVFANNAAAISGGLNVRDLYRTNSDPDTVCIVH